MAQEEKIIPARYKKQAKQAVEVMNCDNGLDDSAAWLIYKLICELGAAESALSAQAAEAEAEERAHLQTIDERDRAEEALSQAYYLIKGESPQWSNLFGHEQVLDDIDDAQRCIRSEIATLTNDKNDALDNAANWHRRANELEQRVRSLEFNRAALSPQEPQDGEEEVQHDN